MSDTSTGSAFGHAGEFLQGAVDDCAELRRILISIPTPGLRSNAVFTACGQDKLVIYPEWKRKSLLAFQLAWQGFSDMPPSGTLAISSDVPVSRGMGSSTADCVACIRAAASYWGQTLNADQVAMLAHQAECFSDATMYEDQLVVFQHCDGVIYERLSGMVPHLQLVIVEPIEGRTRIDTDSLTRPKYSAEEIQQFKQCLSRIRRASAINDVEEIAAVASISAQINQRYHPKQKMDEVEQIARDSHALGVAIAHSGDIQVLLYRPETLDVRTLRSLGEQLAAVGMRRCQTLSTRHPEAEEVAPTR